MVARIGPDTPPPPAFHAYGGRPQGGKGRRAPIRKPQGFSEQKPRLAWVGCGLVLLLRSYCSQLLRKVIKEREAG